MRSARVRLQRLTHVVKTCAGAQLGARLLNEKRNFRPGRERVHDADAPRRVALLTAPFCRAGGVVAAGKGARDGKCDHVAVFAEGTLPVRDVRTCAIGASLGAAERADHGIDVKRSIVPELLCFGADRERNADKIRAAQRKQIAAGVCGNANLIHNICPPDDKKRFIRFWKTAEEILTVFYHFVNSFSKTEKEFF